MSTLSARGGTELPRSPRDGSEWQIPTESRSRRVIMTCSSWLSRWHLTRWLTLQTDFVQATVMAQQLTSIAAFASSGDYWRSSRLEVLSIYNRGNLSWPTQKTNLPYWPPPRN